MEPVDVLRPLPLRQLALRPGELEVDPAVERVLSRGHGLERVLRGLLHSWPLGPTSGNGDGEDVTLRA
jgi:hypothetical protein